MKRKSLRRKSLQQNPQRNLRQLLALLRSLLQLHRHRQLLSQRHAQLQLPHLLHHHPLQLLQFCHLHHQWLHHPQLPIVGVQPVLQPFNELI